MFDTDMLCLLSRMWDQSFKAEILFLMLLQDSYSLNLLMDIGRSSLLSDSLLNVQIIDELL